MIATAAADDETLLAHARALGDRLRERQWRITVAESCTGGWVAKCLTDVAGSSVYFERGWVSYANAAKSEELGVDPALLDGYGAVSEVVAAAMAVGAQLRAAADIAVAISGIAGPGGGTADKPVGTVCFALASREAGIVSRETRQFPGDRDAIRRASVAHALSLVLEYLDGR